MQQSSAPDSDTEDEDEVVLIPSRRSEMAVTAPAGASPHSENSVSSASPIKQKVLVLCGVRTRRESEAECGFDCDLSDIVRSLLECATMMR